MHRVAKHDGIGNIVVEEAPTPAIGPRQVLVRNQRSLISRGSEIGRRYLDPGQLDPAIMGYSAAGVIEAVGTAVSEFVPGQRVAVVAPHAEYVVGDLESPIIGAFTTIADNLSFDQATFHGLVTGALMWAKCSETRPGDTVVVLGQGLVGNLVMQALRAYQPARLIAVDTYPLRCALANQLGADLVINAATTDPVAAINEITAGQGADVVIDCVGGQAGLRSFQQAQDICRPYGIIHLIALYQGAPLALDAGKIQTRRVLGGYCQDLPRREYAQQAMQALSSGQILVEPLITHHFPYTAAKPAFDLLYTQSDQTMGVLFSWPDAAETAPAIART